MEYKAPKNLYYGEEESGKVDAFSIDNLSGGLFLVVIEVYYWFLWFEVVLYWFYRSISNLLDATQNFSYHVIDDIEMLVMTVV